MSVRDHVGLSTWGATLYEEDIMAAIDVASCVELRPCSVETVTG